MSETTKLPDFMEELAQEMASKDAEIHVLKVNIEIFADYIESKGLSKEFWLYYNGSLRKRGIMDDHGNFISGKEKSPSN